MSRSLFGNIFAAVIWHFSSETWMFGRCSRLWRIAKRYFGNEGQQKAVGEKTLQQTREGNLARTTGLARRCRKYNNEEIRKEQDSLKNRGRGEDECEVGDGGTSDCWHRLSGHHVSQTDAPAGPDWHYWDGWDDLGQMLEWGGRGCEGKILCFFYMQRQKILPRVFVSSEFHRCSCKRSSLRSRESSDLSRRFAALPGWFTPNQSWSCSGCGANHRLPGGQFVNVKYSTF